MTSQTSSAASAISQSRTSNAAAAVLAIGGWMGVITIVGATSALTVAAALLVFGPGLMSQI